MQCYEIGVSSAHPQRHIRTGIRYGVALRTCLREEKKRDAFGGKVNVSSNNCQKQKLYAETNMKLNLKHTRRRQTHDQMANIVT